MNTTKRCRYGAMTYRTNDTYIGRSFDLYGEFSEGEVEIFRRLVRPGQTVLNVGANIGAHTVPLAQLVGPTGKVLAFEPQRTVFYLLCANVVQNNLEPIVYAFRAAVGERAGMISVPELAPDADQNFGGLSLLQSDWGQAEQTPVARLDDLQLSACHFIKVDVEGMEREVLLGAAETIRRLRPFLYVEDDRPDRSPALRALLASLGYELYFHQPMLFNPGNFLDKADNAFGNIASHNLLGCPAEVPLPIQPHAFGLQRLTVRENLSAPGSSVAMPSASETIDDAVTSGLALYDQARYSDAEREFRRALSANPQHVAAHNNLGLALAAQQRFGEAVAAYRSAIVVKTDFAEAHLNLGLALLAQGHLDEAIAAYRRAIALKRDFAQAHLNLGLALWRARQPEAGLASCREAVRLNPDTAEAHNSVGALLQELGRFEEAIESLTEAVRLQPQLAQAYNNLGIAQWSLGRHEDAVTNLARAAELAPHMAEARNNLATALRDLGRIDEAMESYERAIEINPQYGEARWNRSLLALLKGDFRRGWGDYESRWTLKTFQRRTCPQPVWDGSPLEGKTILLAAEQGLGDAIQFLRYAPLLKRRGARIVAEVHRPLRRLARTCPGVDQVVVLGESPPKFDTYVPMLSLPRLFETDLESIPAETPYLSPDAKLVEAWQSEIAALPGLKIGIAWKGSPQNGMDRSRSIPLADFEPLAKVPGVTLVSLQKGVGAEQIAEVTDRFSVIDFGSRLDENSGPFMDTSAIMKCLDLVVTCDSALAHLAGAMAVPVWIALMRTPDWRWLLDRDDSPWYPTARLFRQSQSGDWHDVFTRMARAISALVEESASAAATI